MCLMEIKIKLGVLFMRQIQMIFLCTELVKLILNAVILKYAITIIRPKKVNVNATVILQEQLVKYLLQEKVDLKFWIQPKQCLKI
jgi:hypothetical protein